MAFYQQFKIIRLIVSWFYALFLMWQPPIHVETHILECYIPLLKHETFLSASGRNPVLCQFKDIKKGKAIAVIGREGSYGSERSRLPHFLDNRLTDGGTVASLTRRPPFTPREDSWYSLLLEAESTPGP
jgi:hypothetical protein